MEEKIIIRKVIQLNGSVCKVKLASIRLMNVCAHYVYLHVVHTITDARVQYKRERGGQKVGANRNRSRASKLRLKSTHTTENVRLIVNATRN